MPGEEIAQEHGWVEPGHQKLQPPQSQLSNFRGLWLLLRLLLQQHGWTNLRPSDFLFLPPQSSSFLPQGLIHFLNSHVALPHLTLVVEADIKYLKRARNYPKYFISFNSFHSDEQNELCAHVHFILQIWKLEVREVRNLCKIIFKKAHNVSHSHSLRACEGVLLYKEFFSLKEILAPASK